MAEDISIERDIDAIIRRVKQQIPKVCVYQLAKLLPGDDDGLWFFWTPGMEKDIQIESSSGFCPFIVETVEQCCAQARTAATVDKAAETIVTYLDWVESHRVD